GNSTVNGGNMTFTTVAGPGSPTGCSAIPDLDEPAIGVHWIKGVASAVSVIRYKIGDYPADTADGTLAGTVIGNSIKIENLEAGKTYYIRIWGMSGGTYSGNYTSCFTTTTAAGAVTPDVVEAVPSSWFFDVDHTRVQLFPLYSMFGLGFTDFSLPFNTAWFITVMFFTTIAALGVYGLGQRVMVQSTGQYQMESGSYSLTLAIVAAVIIMGIMGGLRIVP
ncbi:unnamed protein product, partial [marine sediment metagenome]